MLSLFVCSIAVYAAENLGQASFAMQNHLVSGSRLSLRLTLARCDLSKLPPGTYLKAKVISLVYQQLNLLASLQHSLYVVHHDVLHLIHL